MKKRKKKTLESSLQEVFTLQVKFKILCNSFHKMKKKNKKAETTRRKEEGPLIWSTQPYEEVCYLIWIKWFLVTFLAIRKREFVTCDHVFPLHVF